MAKHAHPAADAAATHATATNSAVADAAGQAAAPPQPIWHWSISETWSWLGHAWITAIHIPYLGLLAFALLLAIVLRALGKLLR